MPDGYSIEELVINDSFINYCFHKNEADFFYWQQYLRDYPFEKGKIETARQIVLGLHVMLKQAHSNTGTVGKFQQIGRRPPFKIIFSKGFLRITAVTAAAITILLVIGFLTKNSFNGIDRLKEQLSTNLSPIETQFFRTLNGEKKTITLPDDTKIWLNAGSELRIDGNYGGVSRRVYLKGEALFEVTHDESIPFIVVTEEYEVMDLGTVFNVKAYPNEEDSETSLIEGKVEIILKRDNRRILLSPNQKVVFKNENDVGNESIMHDEQGLSAATRSEVKLASLSYSQIDSTVIETAWAENRLEIVNEDFFEMKNKLERWYDVEIFIIDKEVGRYPFTATFEEENIYEVLQALQFAYHFNYSIKDRKIWITK